MSEHLTDQLLSRLIDGDLSLTAREAALAHLRQCAGCSERQDVLVSVTATLRHLPPVEADIAALTRRVHDALEQPANHRRWWPTATVAVASIAVCVALVAVLAALPLAVLTTIAAAVDRSIAVPLPASAGHALVTALIVAVGAPLAAYPLARWR